ncbi:MAG: hypothetical protein HYY17_12420 [Planctomycetes bacterium]|nr:hypothetical protein [Planctomycetota bacterium]
MWVLAVVAFWSFAGALSVLSRLDWPPLRVKSVQAGAIAGFFALFFVAVWALRSSVGQLALLFSFGIMLGGIVCGFAFFPYLIRDWFDTAHRWATGIDQMKVAKSYDRAEAAERDREWDAAVRLYREEVARDPADPEPWRRIAEIEVRRDRTEASAAPYREALARLREPEPKATLAFRFSDVLVRMGRVEEGRAVLERATADLKGTRFEEFAKERLKNLPVRADRK